MNSAHWKSTLAAIALATVVAIPLFASPAMNYTFGTMPQRTNITFESHTDFEDILGSTNTISGSAMVDETDITKSTVQLKVPVKSLKTGIAMRDEHLQSDAWMDATKFPDISFKSTKVEKSDKEGEVKVTGDLMIHGVSKTMTVKVAWKKIPAEAAAKSGIGDGNWARFGTEFDIKLSDFGVKIPEKNALKVSDAIKLRITLFAQVKGA